MFNMFIITKEQNKSISKLTGSICFSITSLWMSNILLPSIPLFFLMVFSFLPQFLPSLLPSSHPPFFLLIFSFFFLSTFSPYPPSNSDQPPYFSSIFFHFNTMISMISKLLFFFCDKVSLCGTDWPGIPWCNRLIENSKRSTCLLGW